MLLTAYIIGGTATTPAGARTTCPPSTPSRSAACCTAIQGPTMPPSVPIPLQSRPIPRRPVVSLVLSAELLSADASGPP